MGTPRDVFSEERTSALFERGWDVAPDGRFLVVRRAEASHTGHITVVQNWAEEFRR